MVTLSRSSSLQVFAPDTASSFIRTSWVPGWLPSTNRSCSTTAGVHRAVGRLIVSGPVGPVDTSGNVTSCADSSTPSSLARTRPLMRTSVSGATAIATGA